MLGSPFDTSTGLPQGCCLSVVGMVVDGWSYTLEVDEAVCPVDVVGTAAAHDACVFADDLEVLPPSESDVLAAEARTFERAEEMERRRPCRGVVSECLAAGPAQA